MRATEILLAVAFLQQCAEHIAWSREERWLFLPRAALSLLLLSGLAAPWVLAALSAHSLWVLRRFDGPYNGGADRMGLLILFGLTAAHLAPPGLGREAALGYVAAQAILSYFISGRVKLENPDWRSGRALADVFRFSAYPVAEDLRGLAARRTLLLSASWAVMVFEALFPLSLASAATLYAALAIAALFHLANAVLFGLNRFFWVWIAGYPSIIWLQARLIGF